MQVYAINLDNFTADEFIGFINENSVETWTGFEFTNSNLSQRPVDDVVKILSSLPKNITYINFWGCRIGNRPTAEVIIILGAIPSQVSQIVLCRNNLDDQRLDNEIISIIESIPSTVMDIQILDFYSSLTGMCSNINLSINCNYLRNKTEAELREQFPRVKRLELKNGFGGSKLEIVPKNLRFLPDSIKELDLSDNKLLNKKNNFQYLPPGIKTLNLDNDSRGDEHIEGQTLATIPSQVEHVILSGKSIQMLSYIPRHVIEITLSACPVLYKMSGRELGQALPNVIEINIIGEISKAHLNEIKTHMGANVLKGYRDLEESMHKEMALLCMQYAGFPADKLRKFVEFHDSINFNASVDSKITTQFGSVVVPNLISQKPRENPSFLLNCLLHLAYALPMLLIGILTLPANIFIGVGIMVSGMCFSLGFFGNQSESAREEYTSSNLVFR